MSTQALGVQYLADFADCNRRKLNDLEFLHGVLHKAALRAGATIVQEVFHQFNPHGLSGVIVIAESHLAIHTWPERGVAAIDLFTCDPDLKAEAAITYISESLEAQTTETKKVPRGVISHSKYVEGSSPVDKTL